jgi:hypothetical protein
MLKARRRFSILLVVCLASLFSLTAYHSADAGTGGGGGRQARLEGILVSPIAGSVARIRLQNGSIVSQSIPSTAKIERNDVHVTLRAFKAGDRVQVRYAANGVTVVKFEGTGN